MKVGMSCRGVGVKIVADQINESAEVREAVRSHFAAQLWPRDRGIITITEDEYGDIAVSLGDQLFMMVMFTPTNIELKVGYPSYFRESAELPANYSVPPQPLPKKLKARQKAKEQIKDQISRWSVWHGMKKNTEGWQILFDYFEPDCMTRAEFYIHTIISKIKYMVSHHRWRGYVMKDNTELTDLIESATIEYSRSVLKLKPKGTKK